MNLLTNFLILLPSLIQSEVAKCPFRPASEKNVVPYYDLDCPKGEMKFLETNYENERFVEFTYTTADKVDDETMVQFGSGTVLCYQINSTADKIDIISLSNNNTVTINGTSVQIRQWDNNGLYANGIRVGPVCPLLISHKKDESMDVAALGVMTSGPAGRLYLGFPHNGFDDYFKDSNTSARVNSSVAWYGTEVGASMESSFVLFLLILFVLGLILGLASAFLFVRLFWWRDLKQKPAEQKLHDQNKKDKKTHKDGSKKEKPRRDQVSEETFYMQNEKQYHVQQAQMSQPASDTTPDTGDKQYENL